MTCSGWPLKRSMSAGSWVAMPTGQVLRWHLRIMMQPSTTSGAVAKPISSAPRSAGHDHVAPRLHLPVGLHGDAPAEPVQHQGLLGLGEADLPGAAGVLDRRERGGAGAAVVPGDGDVIGLGLGHARGHGAHPDLGHQLDADAGLGVHVLEVVDELGQILDGVDVVVRRRRDEPHPRHGVADLGDVPRHLVPGELAALAGLGALGHLDLEVVGIDQVLRGDAEAARRHLLDRRAHRVAAGQADVAGRILAALAGVGFAADAVHGDGQGGVRLVGDGSQRHGPGGEALDDLAGGLDLVEGDGDLGVLDLEEPAQGHEPLALIVDEPGVLPVGRVAPRAGGVLELGDGLARPHVGLAADTDGVVAARVERGPVERGVAVGDAVQAHRLLGDLAEAHALDGARRAGEVLVAERRRDPDGLEDLRAAVRLVGGDAHLGHHLEEALGDGLDVAGAGLLMGRAVGEEVAQGGDGGEGEVRVDGLGAVAGQQREVVHLARGSRLHHEARPRAQPGAHQVLVHVAQGEQRGDGDEIRAHLAIGEDDDVHPAAAHHVLGVGGELGQGRLHAVRAPRGRVAHGEHHRSEVTAGQLLGAAHLFHVLEGEDGLAHREPHVGPALVQAEDVGPGADEGHQRHHRLLADRVDRRVGDLGRRAGGSRRRGGRGRSESTASGESSPIDPMASCPAAAMGAMISLRSSCV